MSTQFELPLSNNGSNNSKINTLSTNFSPNNTSQSLPQYTIQTNNPNPHELEAKLHHSLQTIMDLQEKLLAEKETNDMLEKERDEFVSMTESLSIQLESAQTQIKILNEETTFDKQKLYELNESIQLQKEETITAYDTLHILHTNSTSNHNINNNEEDVKHTDDLYDNQTVDEYKTECDKLRNELMEKNKTIDTLANTLDHMTDLKLKNDKLQNEISKLRKVTKDDLTNQVAAIEKFEAENNELMNINLQLNNEREQLLNQIINKQSNIQDDIMRAQYDLKFTPLIRRGSNTSVESMTIFASTTNNMLANEIELDMFSDNKSYVKSHSRSMTSISTDGQYYDSPDPQQVPLTQVNINRSGSSLNKQDMQLNNIINEYKNKLIKLYSEKEELATQLDQLKQNQARSSGSDDGYVVDEEEEETKEFDIYDVEHDVIHSDHDTNGFDINERIIIKNESDIDNDSQSKEAYIVCDYTSVNKTQNDIVSTSSSSDNDDSVFDDDEEKMIQSERTDCNVGGNVILLFKKFASKFPFTDS